MSLIPNESPRICNVLILAITRPDVSGVHLPDKVPHVRSLFRSGELGGRASPRGLHARQFYFIANPVIWPRLRRAF